jgi:anaerobic selenocysteine-containing dehydrogenase
LNELSHGLVRFHEGELENWIFCDVDLFMTDTAKMADLVLPACTSFERNELKIYRQQYVIWTEPVIKPLGKSRSDADIIQGMAESLKLDDPLLLKGHEAWIEWMLEPAGIKMSAQKECREIPFKGKAHPL